MEIDNLFEKAKTCQTCYGNAKIYVPLPDPLNGKSNIDIMFINERPGRIGTGDSGLVSFDNDDPTANHFKDCFYQLNIPRKKIFITNACLCHPVFEGYVDVAPTTKEIKNCHQWLQQQIAILKPKLTVTLGNIPLKSIKLLYPQSDQLKNYSLRKNIGSMITDTVPNIYPLYHTSLRARITRTAEQQKKDWIRIKEFLQS